MSTRMRLAFSAVIAAVFLVGCSGSSDEPTNSPNSEATAPSIPKVTAPDDVASKFPDAEKAYEFGAELVKKNQFGADLTTPVERVDSLDLTDIRDSLTPARQKDWDRNLKMMGDDDSAYASVVVLKGLAVGEGDLKVKDSVTGEAFVGSVRPDGPPAAQQAVSSPTLAVDDDGRLKAVFTNSAVIRATSDGKNYLVPLSTETTLWFAKIDGVWKIDGWSAEFAEESAVKAD